MRCAAAVGLCLFALGAGAGEIFFQAHRGGMNEVPENTIAAFEYAWKIPGAVPEVDLRTTKDGVIVCIHDATPARTTGAPPPWDRRPISEIPYETLRQWDAGSHFGAKYAGERVPRLSELFARMQGKPERRLYLDIKDVDLDRLRAKIAKAELEAQVLFVHGDPAMCEELSGWWDGATTMTWLSGLPAQIQRRFEALYEAGFPGIGQLQFHLVSRETEPGIAYWLDDAFLAEAVARCREHGVELQVRPFDFDAASLRRLIDLGIRWYVTDDPKAFAEAIAEAQALAD